MRATAQTAAAELQGTPREVLEQAIQEEPEIEAVADNVVKETWQPKLADNRKQPKAGFYAVAIGRTP